MQEIVAKDLVGAIMVSSRIAGITSLSSSLVGDEIDKETKESLIALSKAFLQHVEALNVRVTCVALERGIDQIESGSVNYSDVGRINDEVLSRLRDELGDKKFFYLDQSKVDFLFPKKPVFGEEFSSKFPKAAYDIDEASQCLAFGRSTAAVFHLMKIVEVGLEAIHHCLGISAPLSGNNRNWGSILRRVREEIASRDRNWAAHAYFDEIFTLLDSVKDAWRNSTMHVENKYTEEEAEHIFVVTRGLMKRISSRMDQSGVPKQ